MTDAHTPWRFEPATPVYKAKVVTEAGSIVLQASHAHLGPMLAAARCLLEALRGCLPYVRDVDDEGPVGEGWQSERLLRLIAEADAAILKATATEQGERG